MADSNTKPLSIPWAPLLALVAAVAGIAALLPARSSRPPGGGGGGVPVAPQEISARLWQDPLGVAREAYAKERDRKKDGTSLPVESAGLSPLRAAYADLKRLDGKTSPLVLVVCEPGSPYAEDVERRLRDRVAVVHALAAEGYLPERSTRLRYVVDADTELRSKQAQTLTPEHLVSPEAAGTGENALIPYESFVPLDGNGDRRPPVLVVWLADGTLSDSLLKQLAKLSSVLAAPIETPPELRVVGPSNSLQYRRMLEDAGRKDSKDRSEWDSALASTWIYSCKASAAEDVLAAGIPWLLEEAKGMEEVNAAARAERQPKQGTAVALTKRLRTGTSRFRLVRTICDDEQLSAALWEELALRQVKPQDPVTAIAELDSFFGRASTLAFLHARVPSQKTDDPLDLKEARGQSPNVETFTHLAGIDGALPKNALGAEERTAKEPANTPKAAPSAREPTEGFSQVDYLRRLADDLAFENRRLNVRVPGPDVGAPEMRAVAVLGSDIYDKLQILRTLRPRLPAALFLTLGLDARFFHPDEWDETRNLLAASNYALSPDLPSDREAPAFRDSTQSAVYAATGLALAPNPTEKVKSLPNLGRPHLFEIGRSGPVPLPTANDPAADAHRAIRWVNWSNLCLCLLCVAALIALLWVGIGQKEARRWHERSGAAVPVAVVFGLIGTIGRYAGQSPGGKEPFALLDGISIWPGDFLRLSAVLLALHFVAKMMYRLEENRRELQKSFAIAPLMMPGKLAEGGWPWRRPWRNFWPQTEDYRDAAGKVRVQDWWLRYRTWNASEKRLGRAFLLTSIYFFALVLWTRAVSEPWPHLPVRGDAFTWSFGIMVAAVVLSLFVTFLVVDATELNWRSIRDLNAGVTDWGSALDAANDGPVQRKDRGEMFAFARHRELLEPEDLADLLDIELIASRSDAINDLIYYPCILLTLLIVARWGVTDSYPWPPALLVAFGANAAWALYCAIRLPIEANRARDTSLRRLRARLFERRCKEAKEQKFPKSNVAALEGVIEQVEHMNRGAFVNIWEQPVLRALLVPSGGAGLWALLELLPR